VLLRCKRRCGVESEIGRGLGGHLALLTLLPEKEQVGGCGSTAPSHLQTAYFLQLRPQSQKVTTPNT
jgi:hypothetical protein